MMKRCFAILALLVLMIPLVFGGIFQPSTALAGDGNDGKVSGLLALQVEAKLRALQAVPVPEGQLDIMQAMESEGMEVQDLNKQRIFLHFDQLPSQSEVAELEAMGLTLYLDSWIPPLKNHPTGFILADMPVDKLATLASKNYVSRIETAERVLEPQNDLATQKINADDVWSSYNGTGIRIAVLDSGLDTSHSDIPTPDPGKDYSDYPTLDDDIANQYTGHGTHVTGSVLGRGTLSSGVYKGSAPGANLTFLKVGNDSNGSASTDAIVYAMKAAVDNYSADIVTMSYGGWDSYHDGTSAEAQAVDYAVDKGAVVFISAGNDADDDEHYSGTVSGSSTTDYIQVNVTGSTGSNSYLYFNLVWYDGDSISNDLELEYYDSGYNSIGSWNTTQSESDRGTESEYSAYGSSYPNVYLLGAGDLTYYLKVKNNSASSQSFHIYESGAGSVTFDSPDPSYTIGSPADADSAIAVGAYTTRDGWYDYTNDGPYYFGSGQTLDQISTFSSQGPRVDTGAPHKPNIVAPGAYIISCRDNDVYPWPGGANPLYIDNDGPNEDNASKNDGNGPADYYVMQGTSMACPIAAGVGALVLQKNTDWNPAQVRHALEAMATDKGDAGWDSIYGWGLIDAQAAVNSSLSVTASYSDSAHTTGCDNFADYSTEHTVYIYSTGLLPSHDYRVAYYDGSNAKMATEDQTSSASGNLSSQHTFEEGVDTSGSWNVIICESDFIPPTSYNATWSYAITNDDFTVQESAIPEFPTVIAAMVAFGLCAGTYLWMRRRKALVPARNSSS